MNWTSARAFCENLGGDLAAWGMRDPNIRSWIVNNLLSPNGESVNYWIGLTDKKKEGEWLYVDGVRMTKENTDFLSSEPNDWGRFGPGADCAQLWSKKGYKMDDDMCSRDKAAICERR